MTTSLPVAADRDQTPPPLFAEAMSRADGCPGCLTNLCLPYRVELESESFTGYYHCEDCGEMWFTGWGI